MTLSHFLLGITLVLCVFVRAMTCSLFLHFAINYTPYCDIALSSMYTPGHSLCSFTCTGKVDSAVAVLDILPLISDHFSTMFPN